MEARLALIGEDTETNAAIQDYLQERSFEVLPAKECTHDLPDLVLHRHASRGDRYLWDLASYFELQNVPVVNSSSCARVCQNKDLTHRLWKRHNLPQLPWAMEKEDVTWTGQTIAKPLYLGIRKGMEIFDSPEEALGFAKGSDEHYLLQPFIRGHYIWRLVMSKKQGLIRSYRALSTDETPLLSGRVYGQEIDPGPSIMSAATKGFTALEASIIGVDVLQKEEDFYMLEANQCFGFDPEDEKILEAFCQEVRSALS